VGALLGRLLLGIQKDLERRAQGMDMSVALGTLRDSCECATLVSLRHIYLGSFFLDPEDDRELSLWALVP
jgi:hypothetical protein